MKKYTVYYKYGENMFKPAEDRETVSDWDEALEIAKEVAELKGLRGSNVFIFSDGEYMSMVNIENKMFDTRRNGIRHLVLKGKSYGGDSKETIIPIGKEYKAKIVNVETPPIVIYDEYDEEHETPYA